MLLHPVSFYLYVYLAIFLKASDGHILWRSLLQWPKYLSTLQDCVLCQKLSHSSFNACNLTLYFSAAFSFSYKHLFFIGAYRNAYGTQNVWIRLLEDGKTKFNNDYIVGAVSMDLPKAFDCIPHDLLIANLNVYGIDENALVLAYSYLKRREQSARINNTCSSIHVFSFVRSKRYKNVHLDFL